MVSLNAEEKEIHDLYEEACRLKDVARKSLDEINVYLEEAVCFRRAAALSKDVASDSDTTPDDKMQHMVFEQYYAYEEHYCMGVYYYEKHDTRSSAKHFTLSADHLSKSLALVENAPDYLSPKVKSHLKSFLPNWHHFQRYMEIYHLANDARTAWDLGRFIDALDLYRRMAARQKDFIDSPEFKMISLQYQRIAVANFIGSMTNASSAMAAMVLGRGKKVGPDGARELPNDLLTKLIRYTLDAYRLGNAAFDQNPEWDQFRINAQQGLRNIENFLRSNPSARVPLSIAFEDDADFIKILKLTDTSIDKQDLGRVKILLLSANPSGTTALSLDEEMRAITQKVRASPHLPLYQLEELPAFERG